MKLLLGCRNTKPYLRDKNNVYGDYHCFPEQVIAAKYLNGKIVLECDFEIEEISTYRDYNYTPWYETKKMFENQLSYNSCKTQNEIDVYLKGELGYAIHIKNLNIFEKPDELFFYDGKSKEGDFYHLNKTPKNMMYVYDIDEIKKILLYLYPEELCNILNGKQTILVRRTILKEMVEPTDAERQ